MLREINVDAVVGPTHHFGGLGVGNLASQQHAQRISYPRAAALEGLKKAALVASLGIPQFLFFPPVRPQLEWLHELGFPLESSAQLAAARQAVPTAFSAAFSSAFMWAANSATVSPACDTGDHCLHFTPANLISSWHRGIEAAERSADLKELCAALSQCHIHRPLPPIIPLRDEGAANHMRLCDGTGYHGLHVFVYGEDESGGGQTPRFLPRQTRAACEAIARRHRLDPARTFYLQQHPAAISAGVFHNDVIATSHYDILLHHELAYLDAELELQRLEARFLQITGGPLQRVQISNADLPLEDAVSSYLFNSQIVSPTVTAGSSHGPRMAIICPQQCREIATAHRVVRAILAASDNPIEEVHWVTLEQSMANGGGPACLRLRVPVPTADIERLPTRWRLEGRLEEHLATAIERWYPETLSLSDFCELEFINSLLHIPAQLQAVVRSASLPC